VLHACISGNVLWHLADISVLCAQLINVEDTDGEVLPLTYDPELIADYWTRRPVSIVGRVLQLLGAGRPSHACGSWLGGLPAHLPTAAVEATVPYHRS